jgi:uncharacterized protein (DUF1330 family)
MAAYMIVFGKNRNPDWLNEYVTNVPAIFRRYGGEYLDVAKRVKQFEGPNFGGNLAAIFSFPTLEKVEEFMGSSDYQSFADLRKKNMDAIIFGFDTQE